MELYAFVGAGCNPPLQMGNPPIQIPMVLKLNPWSELVGAFKGPVHQNDIHNNGCTSFCMATI